MAGGEGPSAVASILASAEFSEFEEIYRYAKAVEDLRKGNTNGSAQGNEGIWYQYDAWSKALAKLDSVLVKEISEKERELLTGMRAEIAAKLEPLAYKIHIRGIQQPPPAPLAFNLPAPPTERPKDLPMDDGPAFTKLITSIILTDISGLESAQRARINPLIQTFHRWFLVDWRNSTGRNTPRSKDKEFLAWAVKQIDMILGGLLKGAKDIRVQELKQLKTDIQFKMVSLKGGAKIRRRRIRSRRNSIRKSRHTKKNKRT